MTAFATSYIKTTSAAATRLADSASITGTNFSRWYNQSEGTFVVIGDAANSAEAPLLSADESAGNEVLRLSRIAASSSLRFLVVDGGATQADLTRTTLAANTPFKGAAAYKASDFALCLNAGTVTTASSGTIPTATQLQIGKAPFASSQCGHIQSLRYFRGRLPNTTLQALTS